MSEVKTQRAIGYGYILANQKGQVFLEYLRSNRVEVWRALLGSHTKAEREKYKREEGWRVVPVWIKEHVTEAQNG